MDDSNNISGRSHEIHLALSLENGSVSKRQYLHEDPALRCG